MKNELATVATPATLLEKAIEKGVDIDQLEKLMDMQERWEKKEARKSFLDALSKFQSIVPDLKKTKTAKITSKTGGSFSYKFSDLGSITKEIKKPLNECGLSYRWEFYETGDKMKVVCLVSHRDGHTETTSMEAGRDDSGAKNGIQQKGSTHTYLQRYTLIGALGLSTADEDNDAKGGSTPVPPPATDGVDLSEEEIRDQWKASIESAKTQVELTALYLKNRKAVDQLPAVKEMFKKHEQKLKSQSPKVKLP